MTFVRKLTYITTIAPTLRLTDRCRFVPKKNEIFVKPAKKDASQLVNIKELWPEISTYKNGLFPSEFDHLATGLLGMVDGITGKDLAYGSAVLIKYLGIRKQSKILDIGAQNNFFIENLRNAGYRNSRGIDTDPRICRSEFGEQINFRHLSLDRRFNVIFFSFLLDYFPGGRFNKTGNDPSLMLLASKIYAHLLPKGYLIFLEYLENPVLSKFIDALKNAGFRKNNVQQMPWNIWRKP